VALGADCLGLLALLAPVHAGADPEFSDTGAEGRPPN
jgi:hypothetical protein